eukprot:1150113-Pelagomonas_calceolata.AAC.7
MPKSNQLRPGTARDMCWAAASVMQGKLLCALARSSASIYTLLSFRTWQSLLGWHCIAACYTSCSLQGTSGSTSPISLPPPEGLQVLQGRQAALVTPACPSWGLPSPHLLPQ